MLDFINYPVSAILWFWHEVFGTVFDPAAGYTWALAVVFLVFTLRALLFKPFVHQVRSMRKMQEFAPQMKALQEKYGDDRQRMAQELQKLQTEQGFNPVGGCLPMLVQVPVFIGLFQVLNGFRPGARSNFVFGSEEVASFVQADLFGASLSSTLTAPAEMLAAFGTDRVSMLAVGVPLMVAAAIATHITARHSVARQTVDASSGQAAMMNRLTLWVFPAFALVGGPFLPLAILLYWLANNFWTLGQQWVVFRRIDREEAEKPVAAGASAPVDAAPGAAETSEVAATSAPAGSVPDDGGDSPDENHAGAVPPGEVSRVTEDRSRDADALGDSR